MAIGSETVARIDAELHVDSSSVPGEVRRALKEGAIGKDAEEAGGRIGKSLNKGLKKELKAGADDIDNNFVTRIERSMKRMPQIMGKAFGKGSRNDFLNIVGSMVQGGATLTTLLFKGIGAGLSFVGDAIKFTFNGLKDIPGTFKAVQEAASAAVGAVKDFFSTSAEGVSAGGKLWGGFTAALGPIVQVASSVALVTTAVLAAVGVFYMLGGAVGILTSAMSMLTAGVTAVASALTVALIGAAGAAIPVVLALAAGIGVVALAISNMSDKQKKTLEPLKKSWEKWGKDVGSIFLKDLPKWIKTAEGLLKTFVGPTMTNIAGEMGKAVSGITQDLESPAMKKALDSWSKALGPIAGDLTTAFGKALTGAMAFFTPILGPAKELSGWINKTLTDFNAWASSAGGQNSIKKFFDDAWESAKTLGRVLGNAGTSLGTLIESGKGTGDKFLGWLETKTGQLKTFLNSAEGQNKLAGWFLTAETFGDSLWTTIEKIAGWIDSMNTPENQKFANGLVIGVGKLADVMKTLGPAFEVGGKMLMGFLGILATVFGDTLSKIGAMESTMGGFLKTIGSIPGAPSWIKELGVDMEKAGDATGKAGEELKALPEEVRIKMDADAAELERKIRESQDGITKVPGTHDTAFQGKIEQLEKMAAAGKDAIVEVPPEKQTTFNGDTGPLMDATATATGEVKAVPPSWISTFTGHTAGVESAAATATSEVNSVPTSHTTYLNGDISGLLAKIAVARSQIAALTASVPGAMTNADLGGAKGLVAGWAAGGLTKGPQLRVIGEDGPEAVVPLRRSLGRVDPSVRDLSAYAQGLAPGGGITIAEGAIQVTIPNTNPELAAAAVLDRMVARFG